MGHGSTIPRSRSIAGSSNESSYRSSPASSTAPKSRHGHTASAASKNPKASVMRASTVTSATTMSQLLRSASTAFTAPESKPASVSSTLRPPTSASRSSRASTVTSATSTSNFIQSGSSTSSIRPPTTASTVSTTNLSRSSSKYAPSFFSNATSRILWGRRPPGHSTLQPSQIASLTETLSFPDDTPMLSSRIGALGLPLSRSQFSPTPSCFCDAHFWLEQRYIEELTEVISHEVGAQLDKLRTAPAYLISKKTRRILSTLEPYKDIFASIDIPDSHNRGSFISSSSSNTSTKPACPACTLSRFFQNPDAVKALTTCAKGRKHRNRPWPCSMAWLEPNPGKGVDWEARWKAEGKPIARDRIRVQRWRRQSRRDEQPDQEQELSDQQQQILGHAPGQGCDFCDNLRLEQADEEDLDAVIAEEEEEEEDENEQAVEHHLDSITETETLNDDSETYRAAKEESIIGEYMRSSSSLSSRKMDSVYLDHQRAYGEKKKSNHNNNNHDDARRRKRQDSSSMSVLVYLDQREGDNGYKTEQQQKRASQWARSYTRLVEQM